jgi:MFS family permease
VNCYLHGRLSKNVLTQRGSSPEARLYELPFLALLAAVFLGFSNNGILQPVLPLFILDQGGDATLVGALLLTFTLPSIILRPFIGYFIDTRATALTFKLGAIGLGIAGFLYLLPGLPGVFLARASHGAAWAAFNTAGNAALAELAPPLRRAEASGMYNLMSNLAQLLAPASGLILLAAYGFTGPFVAAGLIGCVAGIIVTAGAIGRHVDPPSGSSRSGFWSGLFDRGALLPMFVGLVWVAAQTLFVVYPPVFAAELGLPISDLTIYYPVFGGALIAARLIARRATDRFPRFHVLAVGIGVGIVALGVATAANTIAGLLLAACLFAVGSSATSTIATAIAIDRADPSRRGAAMATFSLGYPLGLGLGGAVWGLMIDGFGYPAPFLGALLALVVVLVIVLWRRPRESPVPE